MVGTGGKRCSFKENHYVCGLPEDSNLVCGLVCKPNFMYSVTLKKKNVVIIDYSHG